MENSMPAFPADIKSLKLPTVVNPAQASVMSKEDEEYLDKMVAQIKSGKAAVIIVETEDEKLKYMFSDSSRAKAVCMMAKTIEATSRRMGGPECV